MHKNSYRIMDFSYSKLRVLDSAGETLVIPGAVLQKLINQTRFEQVKPPRCKYTQLQLKRKK